MKAIRRNGSRGFPVGAEIDVVDNSGAKKLKVISVKAFKSVKRKLDCAGVGDLVTGNILAGKPEIKHTVVKAVVVRQKQEYKRPDGTTIKFQSNGCVIIKEEKTGSPKGTLIKGPIGKEVGERYPGVARIGKIVV
jgi:large subunit ribosomal protein L14